MRYIIIIICFLFFGCKTTQVLQGNKSDLFVVLIQYIEQDTEKNVLNILNTQTTLQNYGIRFKSIWASEIEATCKKLKDIQMDALNEHLKQTYGVTNVIINPRY